LSKTTRKPKQLTKLGKQLDEQNEKFDKEIAVKKKKKEILELKNTRNEEFSRGFQKWT